MNNPSTSKITDYAQIMKHHSTSKIIDTLFELEVLLCPLLLKSYFFLGCMERTKIGHTSLAGVRIPTSMHNKSIWNLGMEHADPLPKN
jgi:hypothetical protein